jgi:hypothetical protein
VRRARGHPQPQAVGDWRVHLWEDQLVGFETQLRRNIGIAQLVVQQLNFDLSMIDDDFPPDVAAAIAAADTAAADNDDDDNVNVDLHLDTLDSVQDDGYQIRYLSRAVTNIQTLTDRLLRFTEVLGNRRVNRA